MSVVLPYSGPGETASGRTAALVRRLRLREQLRFGAIALKFAVGLPACFVGPLIFSLVFIGCGAAWWRLFGFACALSIPLLFAYEERTRGWTILDLVRDLRSAKALSPHFDPPENIEVNVPRAFAVLELMAIGPRITVRAARELMARARLRQVPLRQVAQTLQLLLPYEVGISPAELAAQTEDIRGTLDAVIYLVFHDWAELSLDRRRVWVTMQSRQSLAGELGELAVPNRRATL